jgi:hypothetical protein
MIYLDPSALASIAVEPGTGVKVISLLEDSDLLLLCVNEDQGVYHLSRKIDGVVFPDRKRQMRLGRVDVEICVPVHVRFCSSHRLGSEDVLEGIVLTRSYRLRFFRPRRIDPIDPTTFEIAHPSPTSLDNGGSTSVFVHSRSGVDIRRDEVSVGGKRTTEH